MAVTIFICFLFLSLTLVPKELMKNVITPVSGLQVIVNQECHYVKHNSCDISRNISGSCSYFAKHLINSTKFFSIVRCISFFAYFSIISY